jgi:predicted hotdog family 3-hydroxylacyl-ACP dehydratase
MNFSEINILELLPQQPPFVMVDKLLHFDEIKTVTQLVVRSDNLFFENGRLTASGLIENIAQTCASRIGYINKFILKQSVKLGYIGAIRNLIIVRTPSEGEVITTEIKLLEEVFKMTLVQANVRVGDETIVTAEMKIALSDIDSNNNKI